MAVHDVATPGAAAELMSDSGSIWITLDDNEVHRARMLLDEIFGDSNFASTITWHKRISPANDAKLFSGDHDSILVYAKDIQRWQPNRMEYEDSQLANFSNPDDDARGSWNSAAYTCAKTSDERPNLYYPIESEYRKRSLAFQESGMGL
jgi:adenine-specific DNA-methyltransferase